MFHLTRYRWIFFALSGIIIVPGLLALLFWHLNLGIDFTNGSTLDLRFQSSNVSISQVTQAFQKAGAQDVQVYASRPATATGANSKQPTEVFIQFSRPISQNESVTVVNLLQKANLPVLINNGKPAAYLQSTVHYPNTPISQDTGQLAVLFSSPVTAAQVQTALKSLPPTASPDATTSGATTTSTSSASSAASATSASPAATKSGTATATATATTTTSGSTTYPVTVKNVAIGTNGLTYNVNTQTPYNDPVKRNAILSSLAQKYGPVYLQDYQEVGPTVANQTTQSAYAAVAAACLAILLYIGIAFRKVGSLGLSFRFGASAIFALLHDALVVLGLWAIFGHLFGFKVDTLFLTAVLTVIGFSVHDTIVVFDRIRENLQRRTSESFDTVVNASLVQTMSRSLNTSLTVLFTLSAEALFGGASTQQFVLALLFGIASGTYSSIFNASMILSLWEDVTSRRRKRNQPQRRVPAAVQRDVAASRA